MRKAGMYTNMVLVLRFILIDKYLSSRDTCVSYDTKCNSHLNTS